MKRTICDGCGIMMEDRTVNKGSDNLYVHIGDYQVRLSVCKENNLLDLCQKCLNEVVSYCVLETDPFVSRTEDVGIEAMLSARRVAESRQERLSAKNGDEEK